MALSIKNSAKMLLQYWYSPQRFLWRFSLKQSAVALTFDDGPDPEHTPAVLDLLATFNIKATFFLVGEKAVRYPDLVRRIADEGHGIGGHTWGHREIPDLSVDDLEFELSKCRQAIRDASGLDSILFRPPRGRVSLASIAKVTQRGYCLVHWTKTYSDYQRDGVHNLIARFRKNRPVARDIVLLHDHNADTIGALQVLVPEWQKAGLTFAAISA